MDIHGLNKRENAKDNDTELNVSNSSPLYTYRSTPLKYYQAATLDIDCPRYKPPKIIAVRASV